MTTYTTLEGALARLGRSGDLSSTTSPTLTEARTFHAGINGQINAALASNGLTVPVTSPDELVAWLGAIEAYGLCAEVLKVRYQDVSGPNSGASWEFFEDRFQAGMDKLWAGTGITALAGLDTGPQSYFTRNVDTDEDLGDLADGELGVRMDL